MARRAGARRAKAGAHGQGCTDTGDALDVVPLLVGLHEQMVRASGNAPEPGTDLVRFRL